MTLAFSLSFKHVFIFFKFCKKLTVAPWPAQLVHLRLLIFALYIFVFPFIFCFLCLSSHEMVEWWLKIAERCSFEATRAFIKYKVTETQLSHGSRVRQIGPVLMIQVFYFILLWYKQPNIKPFHLYLSMQFIDIQNMKYIHCYTTITNICF